jgi:hypothetical protein
MYELVVVACLLGQPAHCEEFYLAFQQPMGIMQCMYEAQFRLVRWLEERPEWAVRRWRCSLPGA